MYVFLTKTRARFRWELEPIQFLACGAREAMQRAKTLWKSCEAPQIWE